MNLALACAAVRLSSHLDFSVEAVGVAGDFAQSLSSIAIRLL